jgi:hypothetical protein
VIGWSYTDDVGLCSKILRLTDKLGSLMAKRSFKCVVNGNTCRGMQTVNSVHMG